MRKTTLAAAALLLAAAGFGLGYYAASRSIPAEAMPPGAEGSWEALLEALDEPEGFARARRLSNLLPGLGPEVLPELRALLQDQAPEWGALEVDLLVRFWAVHDPEGAAQWALAAAPERHDEIAMIAAVETWAGLDPQAAGQYVRMLATLGEGDTSRAAEMALVRGWFGSGLPGLGEYIWDLGITFERQRALRVFARETLERDGAEAVTSWAEAMPEGDKEERRFKLEAFRQVGAVLGAADPAAGVAWCEAQCEGPFGFNVRKLIATHWAARDGRAAMDWLRGSPPGEERDFAVREAYLSWSREDREAVVEWVEEMGGVEGVEPWFRPAAGMYAMSLAREEPLEAMKWAELIENDQKRQQAFVTIARIWRNQDESAAEAWLEQSWLSEEARDRVRKPPRRPGRGRGRRQAAAPAEPAAAPPEPAAAE